MENRENPEDSNQEWNFCEIFLSKWQQSAVKCHKLTVICINRAVDAVMWFVWYIWYIMSCSGARFDVLSWWNSSPEKKITVGGAKPRCSTARRYCIARFFFVLFRHPNPFIIILSELWALSHTERSEKPKWFDCQHPGRGEEVRFTHRAMRALAFCPPTLKLTTSP